MAQVTFFLPVLLQILLAVLLYIALAVAKAKAAKAGQVNLERRALHADAWPDSVLKINNNIRNQFEVPMLYYVLMLILWQLNQTDYLIQALSWLFVGSRYIHSYVHTGSNYVPMRRRVFMLGVLVIVVLLIRAIVTIAGAMVSA